MDGQRFDAITKAMATGTSRRTVLRRLGVGVGAALVGARKLQSPVAAQEACNAGFCNEFHACTCPKVETCGTFGDTENECCRTEIGLFCTNEVGHRCCGPAYVCVNAGCQCNTAAGFVEVHGVCQCPDGSAVCNGLCQSTEHCCAGDSSGHFATCGNNEECIHGSCVCVSGFARCNGHCISTEHCCAGDNNPPFEVCGTNEECANGSCECVADFARCDHQCISTEHCCASDNNPPFEVCGTNEECANGSCECVAPFTRCGQHCIDPTTECCADEEIGILCQAEGFKSKCCPKGHQCNRHERSKTFDCGIKPKSKSAKAKGVGKESKGRKQ